MNEEIIEEFVSRLVKDFHPDKVILFGSQVYGTPNVDSDLDLLVILRFRGKSFRKSVEILRKIKPKFAIDLMVRRPEDVHWRYEEGDPLIREAIDKGKILYERSS